MEEIYHVKQRREQNNKAFGMSDEKHLHLQTEEKCGFYYQYIGVVV